MFERLTYVNIIQPTLNVMLSKYRITKALHKKSGAFVELQKVETERKLTERKKNHT